MSIGLWGPLLPFSLCLLTRDLDKPVSFSLGGQDTRKSWDDVTGSLLCVCFPSRGVPRDLPEIRVHFRRCAVLGLWEKPQASGVMYEAQRVGIHGTE